MILILQGQFFYKLNISPGRILHKSAQGQAAAAAGPFYDISGPGSSVQAAERTHQ